MGTTITRSSTDWSSISWSKVAIQQEQVSTSLTTWRESGQLSGKGGESIWGKPFKDEITGALKHDSRGVLSMANKGSDTNQSQL